MNISKLRSWFLKEKREFPWREANDPYAVWVSEIMLQQTQASVVVPYFKRWMEQFPDVSSLAKSEKEDVVKAWEGLGYYSRARNLHLGAKAILARHGGVIPRSKEELLDLPGIGEYTAGAILNFAFKTKAPAIDGNVNRVIARYFSIKKALSLSSVKKEIYDLVDQILPEEDPHIISEALIELGALICKKVPECLKCPLRHDCLSFQNGEERDLPILKKRENTVFLERIVLLIEHQKKVLVKKESQVKVMQDLFEFPFIERERGTPLEEAHRFFEKSLKLKGVLERPLEEEKHSFTKYRVTLYPFLFSAFEIYEVEGCVWVPIEDLSKFPFSSGHRRVLNRYLSFS